MLEYKKWKKQELKRLINRFYHIRVQDPMDIDCPKTFNEKIQWLKLYDNRVEKEILSDKYKVREYIEKEIGKKYLVGLLGVYGNAEEIDFDKLPSKFALKANHGSGYNIIVKNKSKLNIKKTITTANQWLLENFAHRNGWEMQYERIIPRLIIEEFINCELEYQFWCFNGKPEFISLIKEPHGKNEKMSFDLEWNKLDFVTSLPRMKERKFERPEYLDEMIEIAKKLCKGFSFVRVDLIYDGEKVLFSEMTFTPASGIVKWEPKEYNMIFGEKLKLKKRKFKF